MQYTLVDNASGFIWWQGKALNSIAACQAACESLAPGDTYDFWHVHSLARNETGYHVYETPDSFVVEDGAHQEATAMLERFERVATILAVRQ